MSALKKYFNKVAFLILIKSEAALWQRSPHRGPSVREQQYFVLPATGEARVRARRREDQHSDS